MNTELELTNILKSFQGYNPDMLYNDLIIIPDKNSNFDKEEFNKFIISFSLLNTEKENLTDYKLKEFWEKMGRVNPEKFCKMQHTLQDKFTDWIQISSDTINPSDNQIKLYLSVDNSSLHLFTNKFLLACLENGFQDYDFKINSNPSINRRDNVVIYCNTKNLGKYISILDNIISFNQDIVFNSPHLLGIPYNDKIYVGVDFENGKVSYTDKMCSNIFEALEKGYKPDRVAQVISTKKEKLVPTIYNLIEESNKKSLQ